MAMMPGEPPSQSEDIRYVTLPMLRYVADPLLKLPEEPGVFVLDGERFVVIGWDDNLKALICKRED